MDVFLKTSQRVKDFIANWLGLLSSIFLLVLTLFALLEIIRRYIFGVVFEWGQDGIIVGMISAVALYLCVTQTRRSHLVMNAIIQALHSRGYLKCVAIAKIFVSATIAVFCGAIGLTGWSTLTYAIDRSLMTYSLLIPLWPFYLILMVGFCLMAFVAFLQLIEDLISLVRGKYLDEQIELTTDV
ncbi:MAG: hypothetical protein CMF69_01295 [Magnetovibrio sp.]|nr:hypothetical protein [Magnetovibrio sp.]